MAAGAIANELRFNLYHIDLSAVVSKYIGETEKNLRRLFDAVEAWGVILLFAVAGTLFGKAARSRTAVTATPTSRSTTYCIAWRHTGAWPCSRRT